MGLKVGTPDIFPADFELQISRGRAHYSQSQRTMATPKTASRNNQRLQKRIDMAKSTQQQVNNIHNESAKRYISHHFYPFYGSPDNWNLCRHRRRQLVFFSRPRQFKRIGSQRRGTINIYSSIIPRAQSSRSSEEEM